MGRTCLHRITGLRHAVCLIMSTNNTYGLKGRDLNVFQDIKFFHELDVVSISLGIPGLEVIKLEHIFRLKIKCNDWLLAATCPQAANHCTLL